jgi:hypothetical protein
MNNFLWKVGTFKIKFNLLFCTWSSFILFVPMKLHIFLCSLVTNHEFLWYKKSIRLSTQQTNTFLWYIHYLSCLWRFRARVGKKNSGYSEKPIRREKAYFYRKNGKTVFFKNNTTRKCVKFKYHVPISINFRESLIKFCDTNLFLHWFL